MADLRKMHSDMEPLIKSMAEYVKKTHQLPDKTQVGSFACDLVCAGGCAAICAIGGAIASAAGAAGGAAIADKYI